MKDWTGRLNEVEPRISMKKNSIQNTRQYIIVCKRHERYVLSKIVVDFKGYIQIIRYFALLIYKRLSAFPFQNILFESCFWSKVIHHLTDQAINQ